jgi:hypothetical protein
MAIDDPNGPQLVAKFHTFPLLYIRDNAMQLKAMVPNFGFRVFMVDMRYFAAGYRSGYFPELRTPLSSPSIFSGPESWVLKTTSHWKLLKLQRALI